MSIGRNGRSNDTGGDAMSKKDRHNKKTQHHRCPKCRHGGEEPQNISMVPANKHRAWHLLFGDGGNPYEVAGVINNIWLNPKFELVVQLRMTRTQEPHNHD